MAVNLTTTLSAYKKVSITGDTEDLEQRVSSLETSVDTLEKMQDYDMSSLIVNDDTQLYGDTLIAEGLTVHGGIKQGKNFVNFTKSTKEDDATFRPSNLTIKEPCTILVTSTLRKYSKLTKDKWYGTKKGNDLRYTDIQLTTGTLDTLDLIKKMTGIDAWKRTTIKEFLEKFTFTDSNIFEIGVIFPETKNGDTEIFVLGEDMSGNHPYLIPSSLKKDMKNIQEDTPKSELWVPTGVPTEIEGKYTAKCMIKFVKDFTQSSENFAWSGSMANLWLELQETAFKYNGSWNMVIRVIPHRFN